MTSDVDLGETDKYYGMTTNLDMGSHLSPALLNDLYEEQIESYPKQKLKLKNDVVFAIFLLNCTVQIHTVQGLVHSLVKNKSFMLDEECI